MKANIYVVNTTDKGAGFGYREDNGDTVFVPINVMKAAKIEQGLSYQATLVPNKFREDVPWMAVFAARHEETDEDGNVTLPDFLMGNPHAITHYDK